MSAVGTPSAMKHLWVTLAVTLVLIVLVVVALTRLAAGIHHFEDHLRKGTTTSQGAGP